MSTLLAVFLSASLLNLSLLAFASAMGHRWPNLISSNGTRLMALGLIQAILLSLNLVFPMMHMMPVFVLATVVIVSWVLWQMPRAGRRLFGFDFLELSAVTLFCLASVYVFFRYASFYVLEGGNNDVLVYYEGMNWARAHELFVSKSDVRAVLGLGACGEGGGLWIGIDCGLYRSGVYSILAFLTYYLPVSTPSGVYFIFAYVGVIGWLLSGLLVPYAQKNFKAILLRLLLTFCIATCTGFVGALVNSNIASMAGAAAIAVCVLYLAQRQSAYQERFLVVAIWSAIAAHLYGEALYYIGLYSLVFVLATLACSDRKMLASALFDYRRLVLALGIFTLAANVPLAISVNMLLFLNEAAVTGQWFSWYLHNNPVYWSGSFIAGILMGGGVRVLTLIVSVFLALAATGILLARKETRPSIIALLVVSIVVIYFVVSRGFQYGEHKILQMLGPSWVVLLLLAFNETRQPTPSEGTRFSRSSKRHYVAPLLTLMLAFVNVEFIERSSELIRWQIGPHGIGHGVAELASHIDPGETVVIEDSAWIGKEKFQKSHYILYETALRGAVAVLPDISDNMWRAGYYPHRFNNTLATTDGVDWLVQAKSFFKTFTPFHQLDMQPVAQTNDYVLFEARDRPVAVAGRGWYDCQSDGCPTKPEFFIETWVPEQDSYVLVMKFVIPDRHVFSTGVVRDADHKILAHISGPGPVSISLPAGWSKLQFVADHPAGTVKQEPSSGAEAQVWLEIKSVILEKS